MASRGRTTFHNAKLAQAVSVTDVGGTAPSGGSGLGSLPIMEKTGELVQATPAGAADLVPATPAGTAGAIQEMTAVEKQDDDCRVCIIGCRPPGLPGDGDFATSDDPAGQDWSVTDVPGSVQDEILPRT